MKSLNEILELLQDWLEDDSIDASFIRYMNFAIDQAESFVDWLGLYGEKTVTVGSDGVLTLPAEAHKITSIYSSETTGGVPKYRFSIRDSEPTAETGGTIQYSANPYPPVATTVDSVTATITQGSAAITSSAAFDTSWVGKRLLIGTYSDLYEISAVADASNATLSRVVPFDSADYTVTVEPAGTERLLLVDRDETVWSGDVVVKYQRKHPTLVETTDRLLIPCNRTIALLALQNALATDKYTVDAQRLEQQLMIVKAEECGKSTISTKKKRFCDRTFSVRSNKRRGWTRET